MILHGLLTTPTPTSIDESVDARDSASVLHDLKNLMTAIAAMTARSQMTLDADDAPGSAEAREVLAQLRARVSEAVQVMRGASNVEPGGGVDVDDHVNEHEVAIGRMLGGQHRFQVLSQKTEAPTVVDIDETDLLRVLVSMVRQAESHCTGNGGLQLDVETSATYGHTATRSGLLPPRRYAQLRVSCVNCCADEDQHDEVRTEPLSIVRTMSAVETILEEANGGLRIVDRRRACPAVEVLLPVRA